MGLRPEQWANPAIAIATEERLLQRSCESLIGLCTGLMADRVLNDEEIRFLDLWLRDHDDLRESWPGDVLWARVQAVLEYGVIPESERRQLAYVLSNLIGGTVEGAGAASGFPSSLALNLDGPILIEGRSFCFTGEFVFGPREKCEAAVQERGGIVQPRVIMDLTYLVVGTLASQEWAHSTFGRKIEKAIEYQRKDCPLFIVPESKWVQALSCAEPSEGRAA